MGSSVTWSYMAQSLAHIVSSVSHFPYPYPSGCHLRQRAEKVVGSMGLEILPTICWGRRDHAGNSFPLLNTVTPSSENVSCCFFLKNKGTMTPTGLGLNSHSFIFHKKQFDSYNYFCKAQLFSQKLNMSVAVVAWISVFATVKITLPPTILKKWTTECQIAEWRLCLQCLWVGRSYSDCE